MGDPLLPLCRISNATPVLCSSVVVKGTYSKATQCDQKRVVARGGVLEQLGLNV